MFSNENVNTNGLLQRWPEIEKMLAKDGSQLLPHEKTNFDLIDKFFLLLKLFPSGRTKFLTAKTNFFVHDKVN